MRVYWVLRGPSRIRSERDRRGDVLAVLLALHLAHLLQEGIKGSRA
jgi:hypothetical protein